jgi:ribosome-binding factor A
MANVVREVVSDAIANRLSDPRISRLTSITRVELSPDLQIANVYLSVIGSEGDESKTMKGMASARGLIQTRLARELDIRQCPELRFHLDRGFKIAQETVRRMGQLSQATQGQTGMEDAPDDADEDQPSA